MVLTGGICVVAKPLGKAVVAGEFGCDVGVCLPGDAVPVLAGGVSAGIDLTKPLCVD